MKYLKILTIVLIPFVSFYLAGSFISWSWNPSTWPVEGRIILIIPSVAASFTWILYWGKLK